MFGDGVSKMLTLKPIGFQRFPNASGNMGLVPDYPDFSVGLVRLVDALGLKDQRLGRELLTLKCLP